MDNKSDIDDDKIYIDGLLYCHFLILGVTILTVLKAQHDPQVPCVKGEHIKNSL